MKISAKVIAHSVTPSGIEMLTYEINLPKVLLAEFNTHRVLSKNFSSSRAIPVSAANPDYFEPLTYAKNQSGMVAKDELIDSPDEAKSLWVYAVETSRKVSQKLGELGLHKQWSNRPNDWHTMAKGVVSGTEWYNFFYLRFHPDAQPEIRELARVMLIAKSESEPIKLKPGQWHLPYVTTIVDEAGEIRYFNIVNGVIVKYTLEEAQKISTSCCAQVSYRKSDDSLEKAERVYSMLNIGSTTKPQHASPAEHLATPMLEYDHYTSLGYVNIPDTPGSWQSGITHITRGGSMYSGNLRGYIQYRQLVT
jgi:hypothetical protein